MTNPYCQALGIAVPSLAAVREHPKANTFALLLVALLERGAPMTLAEVAARFEEAGVAAADAALASLKRCRPGRPPVYRDGDLYALDPHDAELDLWAFILGLRPPAVPRLTLVRPAPAPPPGPEVSLTPKELDEAWAGASLRGNWSAQRIALCVLDAHGGPLAPEAVVAQVAARTAHSVLSTVEPQFGRKRSAIQVLEDGRWDVVPGHRALPLAREALRDRLEMVRRWEGSRPDPAAFEARQRANERRRAAHADELAQLRRALVHGFPAQDPLVVVLVDVAERKLETFVGLQLNTLRARLEGYDVVAGLGVRTLLRSLGLPWDRWRLVELDPPQKSLTLGSGRVLKLTTDMLIRGSCGIARPLGDPKKLRDYVRRDQISRLRERLEADARALFAYHQYARLHGAVRLRWRNLDEMFRVPWVHWDEPKLRDMLRDALVSGAEIDIVAGAAPDWSNPWAGAVRCQVFPDVHSRPRLVEAGVWVYDDRDVQWARVVEED